MAAALALHQPFVTSRGIVLAVDTGGDTLVTRAVAARLVSAHRIVVLGRSDRALLGPQTYLSHWYMSDAIHASLGPTWIGRGPVTFDFPRSGADLVPVKAPVARAPVATAHGYPFVDITVDRIARTCLFDTGAVGRVAGSLRAVNAMEASAYDSLASRHPAWRLAQPITIANDSGTIESPALAVPTLSVAGATFHQVVFVRRAPRTFGDLSRMLGRPVRCDVGGALFSDRRVTLDTSRRQLLISGPQRPR